MNDNFPTIRHFPKLVRVNSNLFTLTNLAGGLNLAGGPLAGGLSICTICGADKNWCCHQGKEYNQYYQKMAPGRAFGQ